MAEQTQKLSFIIDAENKADKAFADVEKGIGGLQGKLKDMSPAFKTMAVAGTAAFGAISAIALSSISAAQEHMKSVHQLEAVLKSTGGVAGVTKDQVLKLADAMQKATNYDNDAVISAQNILLTFTKINKDVFPQATELVLDMSAALGQDLQSSAIQLGKALQDPILGVSALRRVGVNFSQDQQDVIKSLVETGHAAEAQAMIMKELATEFGGSAKAQADPWIQLKNNIGDLQKEIGLALLPALNSLLDKVNPIIEKVVAWTNAHPELTKNILLVAGAIAGLVAVLGTVGVGVQGLAAALMFLAANPIGITIVAIGALVAAGVYLYKNWDKVKQWLSDTWGGIKLIFKSAIDWIMDKLQPLIDAFKWVVNTAKSVGSTVGGAVGSAAKSIGNFLGIGGDNLSKPADLSPLSTVSKVGIGSQFNFTFNGDINDKDKLQSSIIDALNRQSTLSLVGGR
jgi:phage-related tail protein